MTAKLGPGDWSIRLTGNTDRFLSAGGRSRSILTYQLERMLSGAEFSPDELEYWSITLEIDGKSPPR